MLELGVGADLLRLVKWGAIAAYFLVLALALILPRTPRLKFLWGGLVLLPLLVVFVLSSDRALKNRGRYEEAKKLFDEHCKTAGVRINRTVSDVEGVLLLKRRPEDWHSPDQFEAVDPYGVDYSGDTYAHSMLWGRNSEGFLTGSASAPLGYRFVVMVNADGKGYTRYELDGPRAHTNGLIVSKRAVDDLPRYGVTYDDISSRSDRENWIAGSRLRVIDVRSGEVLGERVGWMFDRGLGSSAGLRHPWDLAARTACPNFPTIDGSHPNRHGQTRDFVERVLIPAKESKQ